MKNITQDKAILNCLKKNGSIEPMQALNQFGCYRLGAVIHRLRKQGNSIITKRITKQGRFRKVNYAEYHLESKGD